MVRSYLCCRTAEALTIDGILDEPPWQAAAWSEDFVDILGNRGPTPHLRTRVKMLWDNEYLYIGAQLDEPHVWASLTERDSVIFYDNDFEVFIDPDGDNHQYYEIEINALNTVWDLLLIKPYRNGGPAVNGWDIAGLKTAVHIDGSLNDPSDIDRGWSVEMAIPWKALSECAHRDCPPKPAERWRINFSRVQWETAIEGDRYIKTPGRAEDNWVWSPQGVVDMHRPETWGHLEFSSEAPSVNKVVPAEDPEDAYREWLMSLYYAQKAYHASHGHFSSNIADLTAFPSDPRVALTTVETTSSSFVVCVSFYSHDRKATLHVNDESRIWRS